MASPLVETKLYIPKLRRSLVARPRLSGRLSRGADSRLMLISAPAGFGKTTLLAEWLAADRTERSVAWLSLDESDRQPASYWAYLITALQAVVPGVGTTALPLLQSGQPPIETVLTAVLNELGTVPDDLYLVLDDYHLVNGPNIQAGMTFLLEHLPPQVHLVVSTREDPALPLARLRARGELVEIRAADLRFTLDEVDAYLNDVTGLEVAAGDIARLEGRTEGWVAALQLAALSMQGRDDVAGFIAGFAGDDRYIVDYLVDEVLGRQPAHVRSFLVQTSILDRLSGPLCDAVTGQHGGKAMLESLERANLFLVPLDDSRRWYRYHHLFADVLHTHLMDEHPDQVAALHRRASRWYEQDGEPSQAIRHALAAGDVERAAGLVELAIPAARRSRQEATIRGWLEAIPDDVVRVRPVLAVGYIGALMSGGEFEGVEERLRDAERWLEPTGAGTWTPPAGTVVVDEAEFRRLPGVMAMYRAALALVHGDAPATIGHAQQAIDRAAEEDHLTRAGASALSGLALWGGGDLEAAHRAYSVCVEGLQRAGYIADVLGCSITLADIRSTQGRLTEALRTYERALRLASNKDGTVLRGTADMYVGMSPDRLRA
jgi:LuxR family transcriptional regulator, maltose regulon positive regulatory protein